jgi:selenocysteine-specific elongation factor
MPSTAVVVAAAAAAGFDARDGRVTRRGAAPAVDDAVPGLGELTERLRRNPFAAPERHELAELGLGRRELAASARAGRIVLLDGDVVLLPDAPELARAALAALPQPFTASEARQALNTSRRVALPVLEHLDAMGVTRRVDGTHRVMC